MNGFTQSGSGTREGTDLALTDPLTGLGNHRRFFDKVEDYEECTRREGYVEHTQAMYEHMRPYDSYPREYLEVVLDTGPSTGPAA